MSTRIRRRGAGLLTVLVIAGGVSVSSADDDRLRRWARDAGQQEPVMKIGLEDGHAIRIGSGAPFRIVDATDGTPIWQERFQGEIRVVAEGGPTGRVPVIYRVQVGAFAAREAAEQERQRLASALGVPVVVHHDPDRGNWRVRAGGAGSRAEIQPIVQRLRDRGLQGLWIAEEPAEALDDVRLRLVDESYSSHRSESRRLVVLPAKGARIRVEENEYRGVVELRVTEFGTVRPINWINLEQYLRGVVPREMGPEVWPRLEALKAQSVAARTYAWRNKGQFAGEGFDICATPRCQAYGGSTGEHPLSDRAVAATRGQLLVWEGRPIIAYYTATCGGHTENGYEIFPEDDRLPYLQGVPCYAENEALASLRGTLNGRPPALRFDDTGADVTRDWTLLQSVGVIDRGGESEAAISGEELRGWTTRLARQAGLQPPSGPVPSTETLADAVAGLVRDLGWQERADVLLSSDDLPALLRDAESERLSEGERRALAYLAWVEALMPHPDGRFHVDGPAARGRMATALARIGDQYEAFGLRDGVVSGVGKHSVRLVRGKGEVRLNLAERPALFSRTGGRSTPSERLEIWPGDRVRYRRDSSGRIDFLELQPPVKGASDDRSAAVYSWQVRRSRRELETSIARRVSVGRLQRVEVARRGVSGRVVELRVVGSKATTTISGFDVRRLLDLRESLVVLEEQRDDRGRLESVLFTGKGWGHGIGLCQVGSYGMALRGASYEQILAHYYRGARLAPIGSIEAP